MTQLSTHQNEEITNFQEFITKWEEKQSTHLHKLIHATKNPGPKDSLICNLVHRVVAHYEEYYRAKSSYCAQGNVFPVLSPYWTSPLEDAFIWVGGWRPSTAFHLLYSVSGLQLEAKLTELVSGVRTGDLGDLSSSQLVRIDKLQRVTIREEREITERMAREQEKVADAEMVELSHEISELTRRRVGGHKEDDSAEMERVDSALKLKEEGFERVLEIADDLRMRTLKGVIEILSPIQAAHFLITAAELQQRLHDWGKEKEEKQIGALLQQPTAAAAEAS